MTILSVLGVMICFAGLGLALRHWRIVDPSEAKRLNTLVLDVTLPAGIFGSLHHFPVQRRTLLAPLLAAIITLLLWGVAALIARRVRLDRAGRAVFLLTVMFGNTAFVGYPVASAVYGDAGLARAVLIDQIGVEVLAFTLGAVIAVGGAQTGGAVNWRGELRSLLTFPPLMTLAVALAWEHLGLPEVPPRVGAVLHALSSLTAPLVMVALGLVLRPGSLPRFWRLAALVSGLRLILSPALMWLAATLIGLRGLDRAIATTELAMPSMMFTLVLALRYGLDAELTAAFITATIVGSIGALPLWTALVGT